MKKSNKTLSELEDEGLISELFKSDTFKKSLSKSIEESTWDKGLPKVYKNNKGQVVEHWKDGTINILKHL